MTDERRFLFKLASHLGYKTVSELENTMTAKELNEWKQYYIIEPFFGDRIENMIANITHLYYSKNYKGKTTHLDFMLSVTEEQKEEARTEQMNNGIRSFLNRFKG